jgi:stage II sporulation protein Q
MKRKRLKGFVIPVLSAVIISILFITLATINKTEDKKIIFDDNYVFVNDSIIHDALPTLSEEDVIIKPFQSDKVSVYKKFYDGENNKENSIIYYKDTYMQNSGILYNSDEEYTIVSVLDGEVIELKKDDVMGYVVEVKHNNNLISTYQGLKSVNVKKGEKITQNTIIGKSGEITLDVNLKNSLLFELIKDGKYINPELYFNRKVSEI